MRSARKLIYIENQFLWAPEIAAVLRAKLEQPPADDFRLVVVLPAHPNAGSDDDTRGMLAELVEADAGPAACSRARSTRVTGNSSI